jgi:large subunit ribosomal protein L23
MIKPIITEKAVRLIEAENTLIFEVDRRLSKTKIKKEIEEMFKVKIDSIRTNIRLNKKYAYTRLNKKNPAIDVATKLGMI